MSKFRIKELLGSVALATALTVGAAAAEPFSGFGQDIPLESAAKQIVPEGWNVDFAEGVDRQASVSWSSASDWKAALASAVSRRGYSAQFGSSSVVITKGGRVAQSPDAAKAAPKGKEAKEPKAAKVAKVADAERPARKESPAATAPREESPAARPAGGGGFVMTPYKERKPEAPREEAPKVEEAKAEAGKGSKWRPYAGGGKATKDAPAEAAPVGFAVAEGDSLRTVIETWGSAHGWKVVWDSEFNYPISASARFDGDFVEATTALVRAMGEARPAITVDFYKGNQVVVVANKAADEAN